MSYLRVCARRNDDSVWCLGNGMGNYAAPFQLSGNPVVDVAQIDSCGSNSSPRFLMQDGKLQRDLTSITPDCGP